MADRPDRKPLPIDEQLEEVAAALAADPALVLQAPPGAGKTTRVPVALAAAAVDAGGQVVVLQPRRVAARAAARRIAAENGWSLGREVGYQIRFDRCCSAATRILIVTEGILLAMLQRDPFLEGIGAVVFDEFHERSLAGDLCLAMARRVQQQVRPELRLVVMSATLDCAPVARFLGGCPVIDVQARRHEVAVSYLGRPADDPVRAAADGVRRMLTAGWGDLLVFLPGMAWINRCAEALAALVALAASEAIEVLRLHGDLPGDEQDRVLQPGRRRRVILATNIAETSLTIDGVSTVIDSGLARILRHDQGCGLNRLETLRISRASADQRAGRAGRQGPGTCLRLWTAAEDHNLRDAEVPEIARLELSAPLLQLLAWGESDAAAFPWFEAPPPAAVTGARDLLERLGALDTGGVTELGRVMATLPVAPRLARLLVEGHRLGDPATAALAAAMLSERSPPPRRTIDLVEEVLDRRRAQDERGPYLQRVADQLQRLAERSLPASRRRGSDAPDPRQVLGRAVLSAFPDRLARRRPGERTRALLVGGRGVRLDDRGELAEHDLLVAVEVTAAERGRHAEALVRQAVAVERAWLPEEQLSQAHEVEYDAAAGRVRGFNRRCWCASHSPLVIDEHEATPDPAAAAEALAVAAASRIEQALGLERRQVAAFLARLRSLAGWRPELELPCFERDELVTLLPVLCQGKRSLAELSRLPLEEILAGTLSHRQRQALDRQAPERLQVPSGSRIRLQYEPGRPPVLAVRLQELFGLTETPTVAGGRVRVLLHLLAPNLRPQQVTDDLAGFWVNTYPQVRSELRGRYPKHHWPEDPLAAPPQRSPKRQKR